MLTLAAASAMGVMSPTYAAEQTAASASPTTETIRTALLQVPNLNIDAVRKAPRFTETQENALLAVAAVSGINRDFIWDAETALATQPDLTQTQAKAVIAIAPHLPQSRGVLSSVLADPGMTQTQLLAITGLASRIGGDNGWNAERLVNVLLSNPMLNQDQAMAVAVTAGGLDSSASAADAETLATAIATQSSFSATQREGIVSILTAPGVSTPYTIAGAIARQSDFNADSLKALNVLLKMATTQNADPDAINGALLEVASRSLTANKAAAVIAIAPILADGNGWTQAAALPAIKTVLEAPRDLTPGTTTVIQNMAAGPHPGDVDAGRKFFHSIQEAVTVR